MKLIYIIGIIAVVNTAFIANLYLSPKSLGAITTINTTDLISTLPETLNANFNHIEGIISTTTLCLYNGTNFTKLSFGANSTSTTISTSTTDCN
jgi:hypothetical protein